MHPPSVCWYINGDAIAYTGHNIMYMWYKLYSRSDAQLRMRTNNCWLSTHATPTSRAQDTMKWLTRRILCIAIIADQADSRLVFLRQRTSTFLCSTVIRSGWLIDKSVQLTFSTLQHKICKQKLLQLIYPKPMIQIKYFSLYFNFYLCKIADDKDR